MSGLRRAEKRMENREKTEMDNRFFKLATISAGHFMNDFYMGIIPPISFMFAQKFDLSMTFQGLLVFVTMSFANFSQPLIGGIVDKHGKTYLLIVAAVWIAFWMSISGVVNNHILLLVVVALAAMASSVYHPLGSASVVRIGKDSKGKMLSVFMTLGTLAGAVSPICSIPLVKRFGLGGLAYLMIPGLLIAGLMYFSRVQDVEFSPKTKEEKTSVARAITGYAKKWMSVLVIVSINRAFIRRTMVAFGIQILMLKGMGLKAAGIVLSAHLFLAAMGTLIGGQLHDRIGSKKTLVFGNGAVLLMILIIVFGEDLVAGGAFVFLGMGVSATSTSSVVLSQDLFPGNMNKGYGWVVGFATGISGVGLLLIGKFADYYGLLNATYIIAVAASLLFVLSLSIPGAIDEERLTV